MKTRFHLILLLALAPLCLSASDKVESMLAATGGITFEKTYQVEVGYHFVFLKHVALGASVGCWAENPGRNLQVREFFDGSSSHISRPFVKPSLMLFTPPFVRLPLLSLKLGVEGGGIFSPRFTNTLRARNSAGEDVYFNYRSRACAWSASAWVQAEVFSLLVGVGYSVSSLELNKQVSVTTGKCYDDYPQGIFVRLGYYF